MIGLGHTSLFLLRMGGVLLLTVFLAVDATAMGNDYHLLPILRFTTAPANHMLILVTHICEASTTIALLCSSFSLGSGVPSSACSFSFYLLLLYLSTLCVLL